MRLFLTLTALLVPAISSAAVIDPSVPHPTAHHGVAHARPKVASVHASGKSSPKMETAAADRDPGLVCRSVIARALSDWGTDTAHFDLQLAPVGEGQFVFRIDDTARPDPWRETVASGQCLAGPQEGHVQVQSFSIGPVEDPQASCQTTLMRQGQEQGRAVSSVDIASDPANTQGVFTSLHGTLRDAQQHIIGQGRCELGVGADGVYAVSGAALTR